ncbi:glycosyl transferase family 2 [Paenibacillus sp. J31TS4]|uniref:glycosyltransferase family 2 protein n=1 Tax=Paenibacillus sp. J31TS4 TaxID=2807195 RepID=UPI001B19698B|nr:glycosyltransferase family 2 protein [Paenibacillus sp. J31TS4]GIP39899.1 glycosyl transferase family 2 [Paenibacillus sp. J31TS4]
MNSKVSIIIPTFRRVAPLRRAIESVINQTYTNIEIIIVDDNEKESSYRKEVNQIIEEYQQKFNNILYIKNKKNLGSAQTRNIGIETSKGDFITFLDDDDIYLPDKIKNQLTYMLENNLEMSFADLCLMNERDRIVGYRTKNRLKSLEHSNLMKYHLKHHITGTNTFMFKRDLITRINGFDLIDVGDEFYLMLKTIQSGARIGYLQRCDVICCVHNNDGGLSTGHKKIEGENYLHKCKKKFFNMLTFSEKRYINFRHYAVLTYVNLKRKRLMPATKYGIITVMFYCDIIINEGYIIMKSRLSRRLAGRENEQAHKGTAVWNDI